MTVRWVIGDWGEACGPRPSGGGDAGGAVSIEERGAELSISGAGRTYSTEQCWQMHPGLIPQGHAGGRRSWKTTCRTAPNDARQEILQTTISATDHEIFFQESGQYQFSLQGQTCSASSGRWRTYRRLAPGAQPSSPAARQAPPIEAPRRPVENPCATPGAPARIEVRPARKLMRAGESFQFRALVLDRQGCSLRMPVAWALAPAGSPALSSDGLLTVPAGAPDAELELVATAASQSVRVGVDVVSDERYAALLASGNFDADGASVDAAAATITSGSLGARQTEGEQAEPPQRKWTFVGLVGAIALLFGIAGVWLARRANRGPARRRARSAVSDPGTVVFAAEDAMGDKPVRREADATRLDPMSQPAPRVKPATVCPVCGTLYEAKDLKVCPTDGAQLLPVNA